MADREEFERVADALCEVTLQMEDVDLNALLDDDIHAFLDAKEQLERMTLRYRRDQHAAERATEDTQ